MLWGTKSDPTFTMKYAIIINTEILMYYFGVTNIFNGCRATNSINDRKSLFLISIIFINELYIQFWT